MDEINNDRAQKPIKMFDAGKKMNLLIPLVMRIIIIFWRMEPF